MYDSQAHYRALYEEGLSGYRGKHVFTDILQPWLDAHDSEVDFLKDLSTRRGNPIPDMTGEELCRLYALSRVNELLLLRFQPWAVGTHYEGPPITYADYLRFMELLGFHLVERAGFHPFFHEIVTVEAAETAGGSIEILEEYWPTMFLGDMLFSRAGCAVRAPSRLLDAHVATTSRLQWAHRRRNRPTDDLSDGWGGNSQWRTCFRRDYRIAGHLYFNVDGARDIPNDDVAAAQKGETDLTVAQRIEHLTHRCYVLEDKHDEYWHWGDRYTMSDVEHR